MSPAKHHRRRRLGGILAAGSALAIGIGVIIGNQVTAPTGGAGNPGSIPSTTIANFWMDGAGTCARQGAAGTTGAAYNDAQACSSLAAAYTAASCGDSILVKAGAYSQQILPETIEKSCSTGCHVARTFPDGTSQSQDLTGCVFFQPESGASVTFASGTCSTSCAGINSALLTNVSYTYFRGFTLLPTNGGVTTSPRELGLYVGYNTRVGSSDCDNVAPREDVFDSLASSQFDVVGTDNVAIINSDFGPAWSVTSDGFASQVSDCNDANSSGTYRHNTRTQLVGNNIHDYVYNSAAPFPGQHDTCLHWNGGGNFVIAQNTFNNCTQTNISFQSTNVNQVPQINQGLIENNTFGDPCADLTVTGGTPDNCSVVENGGVSLRCGYADDLENITIRFNAFQRSINFVAASQGQCGVGASWPLNHGFQIYGNVMAALNGATGYPASGYTAGSNLFTTSPGTLATGDVVTANSIDSLFTNNAAPTYDYTLSATGLSVAPFVTCSGSFTCPALDLAGSPRSQLTSLAGAYGAQTNKGTGVPVPDCSPAACSAPTTAVELSITGQLDSAGANAKVVSQKYWIVKPVNLVCTQAKPCALVVHSGCPPTSTTNTCTTGASHDASGWPAQSVTARYVLMYLPPNHNCASLCAYGIPAYQPTIPPNGGPNICGSAVPPTNVCDDVPYMKAALANTICYGASPCQNIDPNAVFITGESKGAAWTFDMICDTRTSSIFRGASIVSESFPLRSTATNGSTGQTTQPNCPALGGLDNGYGGPVALNPDISIQWQYGTADGTGCNIGLPSTCYDTGGVTQSQDSTRWVWSNPQLAGATTGLTAGQGQTSAGSLVTPGHAIGCPGTPTSTTTVSVHLIVTDYAGCTVSLRATETIKVVLGGHACPGLKNQTDTATYDCSVTAWNFMKAH